MNSKNTRRKHLWYISTQYQYHKQITRYFKSDSPVSQTIEKISQKGGFTDLMCRNIENPQMIKDVMNMKRNGDWLVYSWLKFLQRGEKIPRAKRATSSTLATQLLPCFVINEITYHSVNLQSSLCLYRPGRR